MDRTVLDQNQAYQQTLASISRRVTFLERRAMWTGAVKQSSVTVEASPVSVGSSGLAIVNWVEVTSLDLEPGRWILFGQVTHRITGVGSPTVADLWAHVGLRVIWTADQPDYQTTERSTVAVTSYSTDGSYSDSFNQVTAVEVKARTASVASLQLGASAAPANSINYYIHGVTLLAFPG